MQIFGMELVQHLLGVRIMILVELHGIPAIFSPVLPVLHYGVDWDFPLTKLRRDIEDFLLAVIPLSDTANIHRPTSEIAALRR